jgi:putative ABC transport system permease protein
VLLGILATAAYSGSQTWPVVVPAWATIGGILTTVLIGAFAGVYPAWRAARISPTEALGAS